MVSCNQFNLRVGDHDYEYYSATKGRIGIATMSPSHRERARYKLKERFTHNVVGRSNLSEAAYHLKKMADLAKYISKDYLNENLGWSLPF